MRQYRQELVQYVGGYYTHQSAQVFQFGDDIDLSLFIRQPSDIQQRRGHRAFVRLCFLRSLSTGLSLCCDIRPFTAGGRFGDPGEQFLLSL